MKQRIPSLDEFSAITEKSNDYQFDKAYPEINAILTVWLGDYIIVNVDEDEEVAKYPVIQKLKDRKAKKTWTNKEHQSVVLIDNTAAFVSVMGAFAAWCLKK